MVSCKMRAVLACCLWCAFLAAVFQWCFIVRWHHYQEQPMPIDSSRVLYAMSLPSKEEGQEVSFPPQQRTVPLAPRDDTPIPWVVFYHIYIPTHSTNRTAKALAIVREQLQQIRTSYAAAQQQSSGNRTSATGSTLILYTTIGQRILPELMQEWCRPELRCVPVQALGSGFEDKTLRKVHAYCLTQQSHNVTVTYLHNKGSHHSRQGANDLWRQHMTHAVTSKACYDAVVRTTTSDHCDACGLLFQSVPSLHFPGNFWTARCDYIAQLHPMAVFQKHLASTLDLMDGFTNRGVLTRGLYTSAENWTTGRGRYGDEQWIASHPDIHPCDVSESPDLRYWKSTRRSDSDFDWHVVPRRSLLDKHWQIQPRPNQLTLKNQGKRLMDYHLLPGLLVRWWRLYKTFPSTTSWVWRHFPDGEFWRDRAGQVAGKISNAENTTKLLEDLLSRSSNEGEETLEESELYTTAPWTVFYHVYLPSERDVGHIINEQLSLLEQSYAAQSIEPRLKVYYSLVGDQNATTSAATEVCKGYEKLDCELRAQAPSGNEDLMLTKVHEFCLDNPEQSVIYFHSKGSFHDSVQNEHWRRHLIAAVTGADCLESMLFNESDAKNDQCSVCSLLFYPVWAFFFPGNFFVGRCSYIQNLLPPHEYSTGLNEGVNEMLNLKKQNLFRTDLYNPRKEGNLGLDRYSWEHWVGSHPLFRPCDVSQTANFRFWVQPQPQPDLQWSLAPRHDIWAQWYRIQTGKREEVMSSPSRRFREYFLMAGMLFKTIRLYNQTPPLDSWVYEWFPDGDTWRRGVEKYGTRVVDVLTRAYRDGQNVTEIL